MRGCVGYSFSTVERLKSINFFELLINVSLCKYNLQNVEIESYFDSVRFLITFLLRTDSFFAPNEISNWYFFKKHTFKKIIKILSLYNDIVWT